MHSLEGVHKTDEGLTESGWPKPSRPVTKLKVEATRFSAKATGAAAMRHNRGNDAGSDGGLMSAGSADYGLKQQSSPVKAGSHTFRAKEGCDRARRGKHVAEMLENTPSRRTVSLNKRERASIVVFVFVVMLQHHCFLHQWMRHHHSLTLLLQISEWQRSPTQVVGNLIVGTHRNQTVCTAAPARCNKPGEVVFGVCSRVSS